LSDDASVIVLYSNAGERSARACEHMESLGYVNVYNAPGLSSWSYEVVTTAEETAVAAALAQNGAVATQEVGQSHDCGCGHDHHGEHGHTHDHDCGCNH
ncbi:rhodanese-like domain-containing protein, partial [Slackia sp.]